MQKIFTKKDISIFVFGAILTLGIFLRLYKLSDSPYWMDEGYTINAVLSVQERGNTILDSGEKYRCPLYCYPTAFIANISGNNAFSYRILSSIAGILLIGAIFLIARKFFGRNIGILSSAVVSLSYFQIAWSHQARWYTMFALFFWLAIFFFYSFLQENTTRKKKIANFIATLLFSTLACLTHGMGYLLLPIFAVWYFVEKIFLQKSLSRKHFFKISLFTLVFILSLLVINATFSNNFLKSLFSAITLNYNLPYHLSFLFREYWLFIIFSLYALYAQKNETRNSRYFLLFIFLSYLIPLSFLTNIVHYRYLFHITPILLILGSLGFMDIYKEIQNKIQKIIFAVISIFVFFLFGRGVLIPPDMYLLEADDPRSVASRPHYAYTPQPDWNKAYAFIKENKTADEIVISSMPQFNKIFLRIPGYWIKYNYLGLTGRESKTKNNKEFYVGAETINNLQELQTLVSNNHGYIIFDFMALDGRISNEILKYIMDKLEPVFHDEINIYSQVWVYKF